MRRGTLLAQALLANRLLIAAAFVAAVIASAPNTVRRDTLTTAYARLLSRPRAATASRWRDRSPR
jgi:hypothetical protein